MRISSKIFLCGLWGGLFFPTGAALAGPVGADNAKPPMIVSTFIAEPGTKYPYRQNMYEPLALPDGRILALSVARRNGQQTMQGRYSTDEGRTWSGPQDLFEFPKAAGGFALFEHLLGRDGEIQIFILCDANSGALYPSSEEAAPARQGEILEIWHVKSDGKMQHWGTPHRISEQGDDLLSVIQMNNGRIVLPISFQRMRDYNDPRQGFEGFTYCGSYGATSIYSDDDGDTWQRSASMLIEQTPDLGTYGVNEPVVLQLKDGRVWMLMRTQRGRFYQSFSPDGAHWSPAEPTSLISSDAPAGLMRLKDGSILLLCNACLRYPYGYGGREVLHGAVSQDEGHTWRGFRELFRDPNRNAPADFRAGDYGCSYSFPTLTAQGNILMTNWVEAENGRVRTFKSIDPLWLYQTKQETDFSSGLDDWSIFGSKGVELIADPQNQNARVLSIRKVDPAWPAAAVWNFPMSCKGTLKIRLMLREGFGGARLGLTDHFSVPWDDEDKFYNVFNLNIGSDGEVMAGVKLATNKWQNLQLNWGTNQRGSHITLDGKDASLLQDNRHSDGLNYLRLRSTASGTDGGLLIASVAADVSAGWPDPPPDLHSTRN